MISSLIGRRVSWPSPFADGRVTGTIVAIRHDFAFLVLVDKQPHGTAGHLEVRYYSEVALEPEKS